VAKSDSAHRALAEQFSSRTVEKFYLTLVHGSVRDDNGRIALPIARDPARRTRMTTRLAEGREALTQWHVLRRFARLTYLRVRIGTGRTHQIRVHLSALGHPVAGDRLYGAPPEVAGFGRMERVFLHAHEITFTSPASGERVTVNVALPPDLQSVLDALQ
jgi:23S rRNA pseudouridine1911/1915/1917 synthase